jgi:ribosome-associated translation inhibitor RaiA
MIPLQITFNDFPESDAVWLAVQERVEKLEHFYDRIIRCYVVISCPHRHRHSDRLFRVQIHLVIPGNDVFIGRHPTLKESHRNIYVAIRDAFDAADRVLQDRVDRLRHHVKNHGQMLPGG